MTDLEYLAYLEEFLTDNRKERFANVLATRTNHFTVAVEDVFQFHNTSAVMRSCEVFGIQEINIVEQRFGKNIDKEIAMGAQKWVDINKFENISNCIETLKSKGSSNKICKPMISPEINYCVCTISSDQRKQRVTSGST